MDLIYRPLILYIMDESKKELDDLIYCDLIFGFFVSYLFTHSIESI